MSTAGEEILESFDRLPEKEKHLVAKQILLRSLDLKPPPLNDEELVLSAEQFFAELDKRESDDGQSKSG